jgi:hypothetical protein
MRRRPVLPTRCVEQGVQQILQFDPNLVRQGGRRSAADPFAIALAMVNNGTVVTVVTEKTATLLGHWAHGHLRSNREYGDDLR